eukprot:scaffold58275_cov81-Phaeocystis_antarctica.AAC.1
MPSRKNSQTASRCSAVSGAYAQARVAQKKATPRATATARVQPRARQRGKRGGFPALSLPIAGTVATASAHDGRARRR